MNIEKLKNLLQLGEGQTVEYKTGCRPDMIGREVCAFLNSGGGCVVCGVGDDGKAVGLNNEDSAESIEKALYQGISPKALISVESKTVGKKRLLVVEVPAGKDIPYAFRDEIFIRAGGGTRKADIATIRDMVLRRQVEPERWERRFSDAEIESDLEIQEIRSVVQAAEKTARIAFRNPSDPLMVLEDLSVLKYGRLTNGGDVLFARNPAARHPQVRTRAVSFSSDKAGDQYLDMKSFEGPLVSVLEALHAFILRNTPSGARFHREELQRTDEPLYPPEAVREGLVNALAHRDYADFSGGVSVQVYPGRLEIWNSGGFPEGITPEKIMAGHISILRNPDIAHVLYLRGMMEKLGRGGLLIQMACKNKGLPSPQWRSEDSRGVTLTFFAPDATTEVATEVTTDVNTEVATEVRKACEVLKGEMTRRKIMEKLGLKNDEYFRKKYLVPALNAGFIEMTIPDKPRSRMQKYRLTRLGRKHFVSQSMPQRQLIPEEKGS